MAKFSLFTAQMKAGRARKIVPLRLLDGQEVPGGVALVPLMFGEDAKIVELANAFAARHGVKDPKPGDPLYDRGLMLHTVASTAIDPESPEERPEKFFANIEEISTYLDPDRVALLFWQQRAWQDEIAPEPKTTNDVRAFVTLMGKAMDAEDPSVPLGYWPRDMLESAWRFALPLLRSHPVLSSLTGSTSPDDETSSTSSSTRSSESAPATPAASPSPTPTEGDAPDASPSSEAS